MQAEIESVQDAEIVNVEDLYEDDLNQDAVLVGSDEDYEGNSRGGNDGNEDDEMPVEKKQKRAPKVAVRDAVKAVQGNQSVEGLGRSQILS